MTNAGGAERTASPAVVGERFTYGFEMVGQNFNKIGTAKTLEHVRTYARSYRRSNTNVVLSLLVPHRVVPECEVKARFDNERMPHMSGRDSECYLNSKALLRFLEEHLTASSTWAAVLEGTPRYRTETTARWVVRWNHPIHSKLIMANERRLRPMLPRYEGRMGGRPLIDLLSGEQRLSKTIQLIEGVQPPIFPPAVLGPARHRFILPFDPVHPSVEERSFDYPIIAEWCVRAGVPVPHGAVIADCEPRTKLRGWTLGDYSKRGWCNRKGLVDVGEAAE